MGLDVIGGRYRLERRVATGGMGVVYKAQDLQSGETVAVKMLSEPEELSGKGRFAREIELMRSLSHPTIVRYIAHGHAEDDAPYVVMEWLEGHDLMTQLARGPLDFASTQQLGTLIADALGALHEKGVTHRDLKPGNVFLVHGDVSRAKLIDLGIAAVEGAPMRLTRTGALVGTPAYMSPEQVRGDRLVSPRADVFALGALLFECIAGRPPFEGELSFAILAKVLFADPPRVRDFVPNVPPTLDALLTEMLDKSPEHRPADGYAVRDRLLSLQRGPMKEAFRPTDPPSKRMPSVSPRERGVVIFLIARAPEGSVSPESPTIVDAPGQLPGSGQWLPDGTAVWLFPAGGDPKGAAVRAAMTALDVMRAMPGHRIAMTTGHALVDRELPGGEVMDRAVSLVSRSTPGVHMDEATYRFLPPRFSIQRDDNDYVLTGERPPELARATLLGKPLPCVGREAEIGFAHAVVRRSVEERRAEVVVIRGEQGIGKSRVLAEIVLSIRRDHPRVPIVIAQGDPTRSAAPFGCAASALGRAIAPGGTFDEIERFTRANLSPIDAPRVNAFLAEVLGIPVEVAPREVQLAKLDTQLFVDQVHRAAIDALRALSAHEGFVIVLEDMQWADAPSIKLIEAGLRALRAAPLLVLCTARPDVDERFPGVFKERSVHVVRLGPLTRSASVRLARATLANIDGAQLEQVLERAQGNALFLEELLRSVAAGSGPATATLHGVIEARLARLHPDGRRLLRAASVFGDRSPLAGVRALLGDELDVERTATRLEQEEAVNLVPDAGPHGADLVFRHSLMREAAYAALPDEDRVRAHRAAAEWLESAGQSDPGRLAEHYLLGGDKAQAAELFLDATALAIEARDARGALAAAARATSAGLSGAALGRLRYHEALARLYLGEMILAADTAQIALDLLPRSDRMWPAAAATAAAAYERLGKPAAIEALGREVLAEMGSGQVPAFSIATLATSLLYVGSADLAAQLVAVLERQDARLDELARFILCGYRGAIALSSGDLRTAGEQYVEAMALARAAGDERRFGAAASNAAYVLLRVGRFEDAEVTLRSCLDIAQRLGLEGIRAYANANLALALRSMKRLPEAEAAAREAISVAVNAGERRAEAAARAYLARVLRETGALEEAAENAKLAREMAESASPASLADVLALGASIALAQGDLTRAMALSEEAVSRLERSRSPTNEEVPIRVAHAGALAANGQREAALAEARRAVDLIEAEGSRFKGEERDRFLSMPDHIAARALLAQLLASR